MTDTVLRQENLQRGFMTWHIGEISMGPTFPGVIPNIDDLVIDWSNNTGGIYRVVHISDPDKIPTLQLYNLLQPAVSNVQGTSYQPNSMMLAYLNTEVTPYVISIDDMYVVYGQEAVQAKLFRGTNTRANGVVISQVYSGSGNYLGENIELQLLDPGNSAMKRPPLFNTMVELADGEEVTLVVYNFTGGPEGEHTFLVKNSNVIKGLGVSTVYLTAVRLNSSMLDDSILNQLNVPANITVTGGDFTADLIYSNGAIVNIPIGTAKCKLYGLDDFNTSLAGVPSEVVLVYLPDADEPCLNLSNPENRTLATVYAIKSVSANSAESYKVYAVPKFNGSTFSLEFYLTELHYGNIYKLQSGQYTLREYNNNPIVYTPNGARQNLVVSVLISDVISGGSSFTHIQQIKVQFGNTTGYPWLIDYVGLDENIYGLDIVAKYHAGNQVLNLKSDINTMTAWKNLLYNRLYPIWDESLLITVPTPTHFKLKYNNVFSPVYDIPNYWQINIANTFGANFVNYGTLEMHWLKETVDSGVYDFLAVAPLQLRNILV
jgi:hypothetical protein